MTPLLSPSDASPSSRPLSMYSYNLHAALERNRPALRRQWRFQAKATCLHIMQGFSMFMTSLSISFLFSPFLAFPIVFSLFPLFVSSFVNISVQNQQVIQHSDTPQRLLLVQEQLPSLFNYSGDARVSPCLSESKHSHLTYFTAALFSSPFFVLTLIRLDFYHQALYRPSIHTSTPL